MVLVRLVFQARFGRAGELAKVFKQNSVAMGNGYGGKVRVLTDLSGQFDTVVVEIEIESLAQWEQRRGAMFSDPEFQETFAATAALIEGGRNEFYTIE